MRQRNPTGSVLAVPPVPRVGGGPDYPAADVPPGGVLDRPHPIAGFEPVPAEPPPAAGGAAAPRSRATKAAEPAVPEGDDGP